MVERLDKLRQYVELTSAALENILEDYSNYVDTDQALFIRGYLYSLNLDFEMAMTRGEESQLQLIVEDVNNLLTSTEVRLEKCKKR